MPPLSGPWPARITWALLPLLLGPALGDALADRSLAVARTASVLAWGTWAVILVAVLLPRTVSLTALRIAAPAALAAAIWAAFADDPGALDGLAMAGGAVAVVAALSPLTGDVFVNGSSYGDERRLALRVPGPLLLGPLPLAWLAAVTGPVAGPLLLAAGQWLAGGAVLLVGLPTTAVAVRALHGLARRWMVLVPAGLVLHDHHALLEPVLFTRRSIERLGPAPVDAAEQALDATQGAAGLALQLVLREPTAVAPRRLRGAEASSPVERILFAPTRPGAALREAADRRIPMG